MNVTDDYNDSSTRNNTDFPNDTLLSDCTSIENNIDLNIPTLLLKIPCGLSFLCLMSLMIYTLIKPLFNNKKMEKFLYPNHPVRCIITGSSCSGKSVSVTNLILYNTNEYDKICIYSPSVHQDLYRKLVKQFSNCIPINIIPNILNEENIDLVIEEIVNNKRLSDMKY